MGIKDIKNLQSLFDPAVSRNAAIQEVESYTSLTLDDINGSVGATSSSFELDPPGAPLKSTQQIPLDFSKFENHTFFNSAESNVNVAFERIINHYPFDGTYTEQQDFLQSLTGFEKYVFDQFPKYKNFARFGVTRVSGLGPYEAGNISVKVDDFAGSNYPSLSRDKTGKGILDPGLNSISFEMQFYPSTNAPHKTVILQKLSGSVNGITLATSGSESTTEETIKFYVSSGTVGLSASMNIPKGEWSHICATYDRTPGQQKLKLFKNAELQSTSSASAEMGLIDFSTSPLTIASGTNHTSPGFKNFERSNVGGAFFYQLSGSIDELRVWHVTRSLDEQRNAATKNIYSTEDLKLYYRFNEPTGSYSGNSVALDSSGNSLHGNLWYDDAAATSTSLINYRIDAFRGNPLAGGDFINSDATNPMTLERPEDNPILFPGFSTTTTLNSNLLTTASQYDANNPNLITRLVPQHYLLEAAEAEGFADEDANTGDAIFANTAFPGGAQVPSSQIIATLLFMYGKFFDELKIYLDHFSQFDNVQYDSSEGLADTFLVNRAEQMGFTLPSQFTAAKFAQFLLAQNIDTTSGLSAESLRDAQNKLWRRVLVSLPEIIKSKGTRAAVNGILNTLGLEHQKVFRTIEFGGRNVDNIKTAVQNQVIDIKYLDFSGSLMGTTAVDSAGFATDKPVIRSTYLSASRTEPGIPIPLGTIYSAGSSDPQDGFLTSGSFTVEGIYKFPSLTTGSHFVTQSLFRLAITGTTAGVANPTVLTNVLAYKPDIKTGITGAIFAFGADATNTYPDVPISMSLQSVDLFDGDPWHVSFGRKMLGFTSASYFLAARKVGLENPPTFRTSQIRSLNGSTMGFFSHRLSAANASGSFVCVGSQSIETRSGAALDLGINGDTFPTSSRGTEFSGKLGQLRFWSKGLTEKELATHALNPDSLGVDNPNANFCFGDTLSGSFERLRVAATMQQPTTTSNTSGEITIFDYAQSEVSGVLDTPTSLAAGTSRVVKFDLAGTGFESSKRVIKKEQLRVTRFTPYFDVNSSDNKVQIEVLNDATAAETLAAQSANDKDYLRENKIDNDNRFLIEVSTSQALDEDIMKIFGTLQALEDAIGSPELLFASEYPDLRHLREIYFNRLESKINLVTFFSFFRFFDETLASLISTLIPQNTDFLGVKFIVSPHVLERGKLRLFGENSYLSEELRTEAPDIDNNFDGQVD